MAADSVIRGMLNFSLVILTPVIAAAVAAAVIGNVAQTGFMMSQESLKPKLDNLNPGAAIKKIFGMKNLIEFLKSAIKIAFLSLLLFLIIRNSLNDLVKIPSCGLTCIMPVLGRLLMQVFIYTIAAFSIVAAADFAFQKWEFNKQQKMSKDEVKQEYKESEGDPHIKGHRKAMHKELMQSKTEDRTRGSKVVVTNPTHIAVALDYREGETPLPIIAAMGEGGYARRIVKIAKEAGIPVMQNVPVARGLFEHGKVEQYIPSGMIEAVAEVLRYVQDLESGEI
jgi:type III secretion protein U